MYLDKSMAGVRKFKKGKITSLTCFPGNFKSHEIVEFKLWAFFKSIISREGTAFQE